LPPISRSKSARSKTARSKTASKSASAAKTPTAAPEGAAARVSHPNRDGAIGTAAKPAKEATVLLQALRNRRKAVNFGFKDSIQPELLLQANGWTLAYLVKREGSTTITARRPSSSPLNIKDIGGSVSVPQAVDQLLAYMDSRGRGGAASATKAASKSASKSVSRSKSSARAKSGNGGNGKSGNGPTLANGLRNSARKAGARSKSASS
jgi:hypothetical protein